MKLLGIFACLFVGTLMSLPVRAGASKASFGYQSNQANADAVAALKDVNVGGLDGAELHQKDNLLDVIKGATNRVLGILGLIALLFLLRGGFQMVTSGGDDAKYKAGYIIVQQAALGLFIIGVARFVVSLILWLIYQVNTGAQGTTAGTQN